MLRQSVIYCNTTICLYCKSYFEAAVFDVNTVCRPVHCSMTWEINIFRGSSASISRGQSSAVSRLQSLAVVSNVPLYEIKTVQTI